MSFSQYKSTTTTGKFLKWDGYSRATPLELEILAEPEPREFEGNRQYELPILAAGAAKVLTLSQRAMNSLVDAGTAAGLADAMVGSRWSAWREGEKYETRYHFVPLRGSQGPLAQGVTGVADLGELPF